MVALLPVFAVLVVSQLLGNVLAQLAMQGKYAQHYAVRSFSLPSGDSGYGLAFVPNNPQLLVLGVCNNNVMTVLNVTRDSKLHISGLLDTSGEASVPAYSCSDSVNCGMAFAPASSATGSLNHRSLLWADRYTGVTQLPHPYTTPTSLTLDISDIKALTFVPPSWPGRDLLILAQQSFPEPLSRQPYSLGLNGVVKPLGSSFSLSVLAVEANDIAYAPISSPALPKYALLTVEGYNSGHVFVYSANGKGRVNGTNPQLFAQVNSDVDSLVFDPVTCDLLVLAGDQATVYVISGFLASTSSCNL